MHLPSTQIWSTRQAVPQLPQSSGLLPVSTQAMPGPLLQLCLPPSQLLPPLQLPLSQLSPEAQGFAQPPQALGSELVSTQSLPHKLSPGRQTHLPPAQV